ncbi:MAG: hypothetical protein QNJ30_11640 [Kiloniellales bacterium]|nr:hypothetical protein [Kiloniellales bacterium]
MSDTALRFDLDSAPRPAGPGAGVRPAEALRGPGAGESRLDACCHGVTLRLDSEDPDFAAFAARNYRAFLGAPAARPDVAVRFGPEAGAVARARKPAMSRLGMGLHIDSESLYWENAFGFSALVTPRRDGGFEVLAYHFDLERERDPDLRARNHQRSLRWALHFPLFHCLAARQGLGLLHASALAVRDRAGADRALVFCGLNGVGKSSLAAFLARQAGYRFMTDNFLLADPKAVYGFPEVLRLDPAALARLGLTPPDGTTVYGKHHLSLAPEDICLHAAPAACFLVVNGAALSCEPLDSEVALRALAGLHAYLGEFPEQSFLAALPLLPAAGSCPGGPRRPGGAPGEGAPLLSDRPWYRLSLPLDWRLADVKELVETCI